MKFLKLIACAVAAVFALLACAGEVDARPKKPKRERRTQKPVPVPKKPIRKPQAKRFPKSPSMSAPSGRFLTREMLTREDREGLTNHDIYVECMKAPDPLDVAYRFFDKQRKSVSIVGSNERIAYELCVIDALDIERFDTVGDIVAAHGKTVFLVAHPLVAQHDLLPDERYVASSWARDYIYALAEDMRDALKDVPLVDARPPLFTISSIVRSKDVQRRQWNSPVRCLSPRMLCSSHTTGSTFDVALKGYSDGREEVLLGLLREDRANGVIFFIRESKPGPHYHVFVYPPEFRARFERNNVAGGVPRP